MLTRSITAEERPQVYAAHEDPKVWLEGTPLVDKSFPGIQELGQRFKNESESRLEIMQKAIQWTSSEVHGQGKLEGLDATTVFKSRVSSCTGYANLSSAIGRAAGVPTRSLANLMVGLPQHMHSITEFYLGKSLGWGGSNVPEYNPIRRGRSADETPPKNEVAINNTDRS